MVFFYRLLFVSLFLSGCEKVVENPNLDQELLSNDKILTQVSKNAKQRQLNYLFSIDHSRLAAKSGELLDASKVALYSNPSVNSQLLKENIRAGLDLPYRVQAFYHNSESKTIYTNSQFLKKRHGLVDSSALNEFNEDLKQLTLGLTHVSFVSTDKIDKNYGIVELISSLEFEPTINALKEDIMAEGDTVWFYTLDYKEEAKKFNISLPNVKLLVFGAPVPGAKAMRDFPSIGLDTFGQKVLVYEEVDKLDGSAKIKVIYNDVPALAELHYQDHSIAHKVIKFRLKNTLSGAI